MEKSEAPVGSIKVADGVWEVKVSSPEKEEMYFRMEELNEENRTGWTYYSKYCGKMGDQRGLFYGLVHYAKEKKVFDLQDKFFERTGLSKSEYEECCKNILSKHEKLDNLMNALDKVEAGAEAFSPSTQTHVAYFSKKALGNKKLILQTDKNPFASPLNLKEFNTHYGDLIMSVGVKLYEDSLCYQNRGIFSSPKRFIDGDYRNVATLLHACTARVCKEISEKIKYLIVYPTGPMSQILKRDLKDTLVVGHEDVEKVLGTKEYPGGMDFAGPHLMPIDELIKIFNKQSM